MRYNIEKSAFNPTELEVAILRRGLTKNQANKMIFGNSDGLYKLLKGSLHPHIDLVLLIVDVLQLSFDEMNSIFFEGKLTKK